MVRGSSVESKLVMSRKNAPKILATAEFTRDMVNTLQTYFDKYEVDGVVQIEVTDKGLWLPNPLEGGQQFLGSVRTVFGDSAL